jgi:hypothetical protein
VSTLTLVGIGIMLSIFYGQYRWLTSGIVASSVEQHEVSLAGSFERRARGQLHNIADELADAADGEAARQVLQRAIVRNEMLVGLHFAHVDGTDVQSGVVARKPVDGSTLWGDEQLYMSYQVTSEDQEIGTLTSSFSLTTLIAESEAFERELVDRRSHAANAGVVRLRYLDHCANAGTAHQGTQSTGRAIERR